MMAETALRICHEPVTIEGEELLSLNERSVRMGAAGRPPALAHGTDRGFAALQKFPCVGISVLRNDE
jgi:hypothetical protein